jgi:hypothetical protein
MTSPFEMGFPSEKLASALRADSLFCGKYWAMRELMASAARMLQLL